MAFNEQEFNGYKNVFTKILHGKETKSSLYNILQEEGMPPAKRVAEVAKMVSQQANKVMKDNNKAPETETVIGSAIYLASDIMDVVEKGGFFETSPEEKAAILEASNKAVFKQGIKDKLVDPVDLQKVLNEGMDEGMTKQGLAQEGVPDDADETVAMEQYTGKRMEEAASERQAQAPQQALGGMEQ